MSPRKAGFWMRGPAAQVPGRLAGLRPRLVVLSSPYPASECLRRLAAVTTQRGFTSWHLDPQNASRPAPRFRGTVSPSLISVARFEDAAKRNRFAPWVQARLEAGGGGGSTLTGNLGLHPAVRGLIPVVAAVTGLIAASVFAGGVALLVSGHLGALPAVLIPPAVSAFIAGFTIAGLRKLERDIPKLVKDLNAALASSSVPPGHAGVHDFGNDA